MNVQLSDEFNVDLALRSCGMHELELRKVGGLEFCNINSRKMLGGLGFYLFIFNM